jgi:ribosomal protein L11 methyltransferase
LEGIAIAPLDRPALDLALALAAAAAGVAVPEVTIEKLAGRDWLAENRDRFSPFQIGLFRIREPDDTTPRRSGLFDLRIEAATAFGSGRHGSTEGCLRAISSLVGKRIRRPVDIGSGSGILAIAAAKLWRSTVMACDIDAAAVAVARVNAKLNRVAPLVRFINADGWRSPALAAAGPYDLVMCNILARPLKRLARESFRHTAPGGMVVLSGLLVEDGADVLACYRAAGFRLVRRIDVDAWRTLLLRRPAIQA